MLLAFNFLLLVFYPLGTSSEISLARQNQILAGKNVDLLNQIEKAVGAKLESWVRDEEYKYFWLGDGYCKDFEYLDGEGYPPLLASDDPLYNSDRKRECMNRCIAEAKSWKNEIASSAFFISHRAGEEDRCGCARRDCEERGGSSGDFDAYKIQWKCQDNGYCLREKGSHDWICDLTSGDCVQKISHESETSLARENMFLAAENSKMLTMIEEAVGDHSTSERLFAQKNQILVQENAKMMDQIEEAVGGMDSESSLSEENRILARKNVKLMSQIEEAVGAKLESWVRDEEYKYFWLGDGYCDDFEYLDGEGYPPLLASDDPLYNSDRKRECMNRCIKEAKSWKNEIASSAFFISHREGEEDRCGCARRDCEERRGSSGDFDAYKIQWKCQDDGYCLREKESQDWMCDLASGDCVQKTSQGSETSLAQENESLAEENSRMMTMIEKAVEDQIQESLAEGKEVLTEHNVGTVTCATMTCYPLSNCMTSTCVNGKCVDTPKPKGATCHDGVDETSHEKCDGKGYCIGLIAHNTNIQTDSAFKDCIDYRDGCDWIGDGYVPKEITKKYSNAVVTDTICCPAPIEEESLGKTNVETASIQQSVHNSEARHLAVFFLALWALLGTCTIVYCAVSSFYTRRKLGKGGFFDEEV